MEIKDIEELAVLSRIDLSSSEKEEILGDVESILGYVDQVQKITAEGLGDTPVGAVKNVFREDAVTHESGEHTEKILDEAPETKDGYIKVRKIL